MTVLSYPSKSDGPTITNWKNNDIDAFERYCTESRLFQFSKDEAWRALNQVFPYKTMDTLQGIVKLTRYERHLPRIPILDMDIKDVIRLLRGVAETTDNNATYNYEDTFENNLFKITEGFVPDNMEEAQMRRFQIMRDCLKHAHHLSLQTCVTS